MFGLSINKVTGNSMLPVLPEHSFVVFRTFLIKHSLKKNLIVRVCHPEYGLIIKKIKKVNQDGSLLLEGFNTQQSVTSEQMGVVSAKSVTGILLKVIK